MNKILIICDRDGTLTHNNQSKKDGPFFVLDKDDIEFIPGALDGLLHLRDELNPMFAMVTFQNCIAKGVASLADVRIINREILNRIICATGIQFYSANVAWGMTNKVNARIAQITDTIYHLCDSFIPEHIWLIDDSVHGIDAAQALGIMSVYIENPYRHNYLVRLQPRTFIVRSMEAAADVIIREHKQELMKNEKDNVSIQA